MPYLIVSWFELNNIVHAPGIYFKKIVSPYLAVALT